MSKKMLVFLAAAAALAIAPSARAYDFTVSGSGITASGWFHATPTGTPDTYQITDIGGTFTDTVAGFSGSITGLYTPISYVSTPGSIAYTSSGLSYDDTFYPSGNSPNVCPGYPFSGGYFDIYGVAFNVSGGYTVGLWSDGVIPGPGLLNGVGDSLGATILDDPQVDFEGEGALVTVTITPEPSSLLLLATGLLGLLALAGRIKPSTAIQTR